MKFISLFTKAPSHQRFAYNPRFYDPKKEEMEERERRIKSELDASKGNPEDLTRHRSRIAGSFQAARKRSKAASEPNAAVLRSVILICLVVFLMAFITWGKAALYGLFILIPVYVYLKFKK
jgi:hypothetical protein